MKLKLNQHSYQNSFDEIIFSYRYIIKVILCLKIPILITLICFSLAQQEYLNFAILFLLVSMDILILFTERIKLSEVTKTSIIVWVFKIQIALLAGFLLYTLCINGNWEMMPWIFVLFYSSIIVMGTRVGTGLSICYGIFFFLFYFFSSQPEYIVTSELIFKFIPSLSLSILFLFCAEKVRLDYRKNLVKANQELTESNEKRSLEILEKAQSENINKVLFSISNAVNITEELQDLYKQIHVLVGGVIDATNFFIAIVNERKQTLYFPYYVDTVDDDFAPITNFDTNDSLTGFVVSNRKPALLKKKKLQELADKNGVWGPVPLIWMGVPLMVRNEIIGVIVVQSYTDPLLYSQKDLNVLVSISDQMAIAIDRKRTEKELIESEKKYRLMMASMTDPLYICSSEKKIEYMNPALVNRLGRDATGENCYEALHGLGDTCDWCVFDKIQFNSSIENEIISPLDNRTYRITNMPIYNDDDTISKMAIYKDITDYLEAVAEKEKTQVQLVQAQKMESIGTLAGGIAHDFNNILSSIIGYTELALGGVEKGSELEDDLQEVCNAGFRARDLVKQILAFARQSDEAVKPVQVNVIAREVLKFIKSSIPSTIQVNGNINSDSLIMGSSIHIHQILMNMCTNAAYAMEEKGGTLDVSVNDITIDKKAGIPDLKYGDYIEIEVSDTGTGISPWHVHSIFEPYFTTKTLGEGTGMGLAVVHGIVESYGGKIVVDSKINKGTRFFIYLPITKKRNLSAKFEEEDLPSGNENILFIDDEIPIAKMGGKVLEQLGYCVTTRTNSVEALELFKSRPHAFDLVVTDMTMPHMTGDKLAKALMEIRADIPVILCTGYTRKISEKDAAKMNIKAFAYKPITKTDLAKTVRNVLDEANRF